MYNSDVEGADSGNGEPAEFFGRRISNKEGLNLRAWWEGGGDHFLDNWLTHSCLVNLIDVSLACEDGNSKLVEVAFLDRNQIV